MSPRSKTLAPETTETRRERCMTSAMDVACTGFAFSGFALNIGCPEGLVVHQLLIGRESGTRTDHAPNSRHTPTALVSPGMRVAGGLGIGTLIPFFQGPSAKLSVIELNACGRFMNYQKKVGPEPRCRTGFPRVSSLICALEPLPSVALSSANSAIILDQTD